MNGFWAGVLIRELQMAIGTAVATGAVIYWERWPKWFCLLSLLTAIRIALIEDKP